MVCRLHTNDRGLYLLKLDWYIFMTFCNPCFYLLQTIYSPFRHLMSFEILRILLKFNNSFHKLVILYLSMYLLSGKLILMTICNLSFFNVLNAYFDTNLFFDNYKMVMLFIPHNCILLL